MQQISKNPQSEEMNVWDTKAFFQKNGSFPEMTVEESKTFLHFAKVEVSNAIESYERYTYNHGGLRQEAKDLLKEVEEAEAMKNAIQKKVESEKKIRVAPKFLNIDATNSMLRGRQVHADTSIEADRHIGTGYIGIDLWTADGKYSKLTNTRDYQIGGFYYSHYIFESKKHPRYPCKEMED